MTNSPSLARIVHPNDTPTSTTNIVSLLTVIPSGHTHHDRFSAPPLPNFDTHPSSIGPTITEISDDKESGDELESLDNDLEMRPSVNRNSSVLSDKTRISRQFSFGSKSTDSPSLPKRNQPITSSAPSTLNKKNLEEDDKKEVYV